MTALDISQVRFLVVEDNPFMTSLLRQTLRALGVLAVVEAKDGSDALERMGECQPDIVLLDWQMAPMDGIEFTQRLRQDIASPHHFLPIIMITAHSELDRVTEARDAGVNEVLAKPISPSKLYTRIHAVIERPRLFIEAPTYIGPDRRRRIDSRYKGDERRAARKAELSLVA